MVTNEGGKVAQGFGKQRVVGLVSSLGQPKSFTDLLSSVYSSTMDDGDVFESFRCVRPAYNTVLNAKLGGGDETTCTNYEEGLGIIAKYTTMSQTVMPISEPRKEVPDCLKNGDCEFIKADGPGGEGYAAPGTTYADHGGRWAQSCDYYTSGFNEDIKKMSEKSTFVLDVVTYLNKVPCMCRWQLASQQLFGALALPSGPFAAFLLRLPTMFDCPKAKNPMTQAEEVPARYDCSPTAMPYVSHQFSVPNMVSRAFRYPN